MNQKKIHKMALVLIFTITFAGLSAVEPVQSHIFYKIVLRINVTNSASMNDTAIKENIDTVNMIFGPCKIRFNVVATKRNVDANADTDHDKAILRYRMDQELEKKPTNGRGGGISVTGSIGGNDSKTNGVTTVGDLSSVVVKDGTDGETWAHELAHGLGLSHNKNKTTGKYDPDGDGDFNTATDMDNMLWPFKNQRTGTKFTEDQCKKMQENALQYGIGGYNSAQFGTIGNDSVLDYLMYFWTGDNTTLDDPAIDWKLYKTLLNSTEPFEYFSATWRTSSVVNQSKPVDTYLSLGFDSDNNTATGTEFANVTGIDKILQLWLYGTNMSAMDIYVFLSYTSGEGGGDILANVTWGDLFSDKEFSEPQNVTETAVQTYVKVTMKWSDLEGVENGVPAVSVIEDFASSTTSSINGTFYTEIPDEPRINVDTMQVWDGYDLKVNGTNFTPNSDATLYFEDYLSMPISIGSDGSFSTTMTVTSVPLGTYFLEVIDDEGYVAIMIMDVIEDPNPPTTSQTTSMSSTTSTSSTSGGTSSTSTTSTIGTTSSTTSASVTTTTEPDDESTSGNLLSMSHFSLIMMIGLIGVVWLKRKYPKT